MQAALPTMRRDLRQMHGARPGGRRPNRPDRVLVTFRHGLGDAVQLTAVLRHLRHHHPHWEIDVAALAGKHSAFCGLCRHVRILGRHEPGSFPYERRFDLAWHECRRAYSHWPSTKTVRCLLEEFRLSPILDLCRYTIQPSRAAEQLARRYLGETCQTGPDDRGRFPAVLLHYQGNTSKHRKDLPHRVVGATCEAVLRAGGVPIILDWDGRSPLADGVRVHNPGVMHRLWSGKRTGDAQVLAALIEASVLMLGIDSGPLHAAGATTTATVGVWTRHHPVHYFDLADNVLHLVPEHHEKSVAGPAAVEFFRTHYRHRVYKRLGEDLPALVEARLTAELQNRRKG